VKVEVSVKEGFSILDYLFLILDAVIKKAVLPALGCDPQDKQAVCPESNSFNLLTFIFLLDYLAIA
jgi:hypothetical protein